MIEYDIVSVHDRKKLYPGTKEICDYCHGKIQADWTLVSHTQLGPRLFCTTCGISQLSSDMQRLSSMINQLSKLLPLAPKPEKLKK